MSSQEIYDCLDFIRNCDEGKEIIQELIYSDYSFDDIFDFSMRKFLKSFRFEYKFVFSFVEEDAVFNIKSFKERAVHIEESNHIVIKRLDISSILEQKINDMSTLDAIDELQAKELHAFQTADKKTGRMGS